MSSSISRRTLAKGAAWSIPAVAIASPAPAVTISGKQPVPAIGHIFFGTGAWNAQQTDVYFIANQADCSDKNIGMYAGQQIQYVVSGTNVGDTPTKHLEMPAIAHNPGVTVESKQVDDTITFTVTATQNISCDDLKSQTSANPFLHLIWENSADTNSASITPQTNLTMGDGENSVTVVIPRRTRLEKDPTLPVIFTNRTGNWCYPEVQYGKSATDGYSNCFITGVGQDPYWGGTQTTNGTCTFYRAADGSYTFNATQNKTDGQVVIPPVCGTGKYQGENRNFVKDCDASTC